MLTIKQIKAHIPQEVHEDFRWAAKIVGHTVQQAAACAIENYIANVKIQLTKKER